MDLFSQSALGEAARLGALRELEVLDTEPDRNLDRVTRILARTAGTESAALSLIDSTRQWFMARHNIPFSETPRDVAFCSYTVALREIFVVLDAAKDERFSSNPLVTDGPRIRFYAGAPLFTEEGQCLGSLCVIDSRPREKFDEHDRAILEECARLATDFVLTRRQRKTGEMMAKVVEATSDAVVAADKDGTILYWNAAGKSIFGYSRDEIVGQSASLIVPTDFPAQDMGNLTAVSRAGPAAEGAVVELQARHKDGHLIPVEMSVARWGDEGVDPGFAAIIRDISDRKKLEDDRRRSRTFLDTVVENLPVMVFVKEAQTRRYLLVNRKAQDLVGMRAEDMIGRTDGELFPDIGRDFETRDSAAVTAGAPTVFESTFTRDDGSRVDLKTTRVLVDGPDGPRQYLLGISEDTTKLRRVEAVTHRLAHYDALTGCLNRSSYFASLQRLVGAAQPFAMLSIDLDRFKAVNDQFGHLVGDDVLTEVSRRLLEAVEDEEAEVARIGGDEFVVLLTGSGLRERAARLGKAIIEIVSRPIQSNRVSAHLGASIGVVLYPDDGTRVEKLRENADLALYRAKAEGRGTTCFFNSDMDTALRDRQRLEGDLRQAIEQSKITLHYQPIICVETGEMTSVEALARWEHGKRGAIPPDQFISVAEDSGLIEELGRQLLRQACVDAAGWQSDIRVAVNLSPMQFHSGALVGHVSAALEESGLPSSRLLLEVTERIVIQHPEQTFKQLRRLRGLGIEILMDDFGIGHSALNYFLRFPFDKVKIDKEFIADIESSPAARAIVRAVVGLGKDLSMGVVAEGIETEAHLDHVKSLGCTHVQGYLISRPLPPEKIDAFGASLRNGAAA